MYEDHIKIHSELNNISESNSIIRMPESRLWKAVILNALSDALRKPSSKYCRINKENATSWLLKDEKNFFQVCELAGLSSSRIRSRAVKLILEKGENMECTKK